MNTEQEDLTAKVARLAAENDRLCKISSLISKKHAKLLFAFVDLVETGIPKPFSDLEKPFSLGDGFAAITTLNKWRAENKLNINVVDDD